MDDLAAVIRKSSKIYKVVHGEILSDKDEVTGRINADQTFVIERRRPATPFQRFFVGSNYGGLTAIVQGQLGSHVGLQSIVLLDVEGNPICGIEIRRQFSASVSE